MAKSKTVKSPCPCSKESMDIRVPTGIPGLDEMIEGGFKRGSTILVVGGCGSGKSTFSMQYLYNGALAGDPGVYVSFEENPVKMKSNFSRFGWDLDGLEKKGKLRIIKIEPREIVNVLKEDYGTIVDAIEDIGAKRIVIDSISTFELMLKDDYDRRDKELNLFEWLCKHDCTSLIVSESEQKPSEHSLTGLVAFLVDGVVVLYNVTEGNTRQNAIEILKLRGTKHLKKIVPFTIENGIEVYPNEQMFEGGMK